MKSALITAIGISCGLLFCECAVSQKTSFRRFDPKDDLLNTRYTKLKIPNLEHQCGIGPQVGFKDAPSQIEVFPTSISAKVGEKVELRFDASTICFGQTITDSTGIEFGNPGMHRLGYIEFEPGVVLDLPDVYGIGTFETGYTQPRSGSVLVSIDVRCAVPKSNQACRFSRQIPISIIAKSQPQGPPKSRKQSGPVSNKYRIRTRRGRGREPLHYQSIAA